MQLLWQIPAQAPPEELVDIRTDSSDNAGMSLRLMAGFLFILLLAPIPAQSRDNDRLALVFLESAIEAYASGNQALTQELVARSLAFSGRFGDAHYLDALFALQENLPREALEKFLTAREKGGLLHFSEEELSVQIASLLYRLGDYQALLDLVLPEAGQGLLFEHPDLAYYALQAIERSGQGGNYSSRTDRILRAFPDDLRVLEAGEPRSLPPSLFLEQRMEQEARLGDTFLDALPAFVDRLGPGESRMSWIKRYWQSGGEDLDRLLAYYIEDVAEDAPRLQAVVHEKILAREFKDLDAFRAIVSALEDSQYRDMLLNMYTHLSGTLYRDENLDGYRDSEFQFLNGLLQRVILDRDQDGLAEVLVNFNTSLPVDLSIFTDEKAWNISYGHYPFVEFLEAVHFQEESREQWILPSLNTSLLALEDRTDTQDFSSLRIPELKSMEEISESLGRIIQDLESLAFRKDLSQAQPPLLQEVRGLDPVYRRVDADGNGLFEGYQVFLDGGTHILDYRDLDEDGWYELGMMDGLETVFYREADYSQAEYLDPERASRMDPPDAAIQELFETYQVIVGRRSPGKR